MKTIALLLILAIGLSGAAVISTIQQQGGKTVIVKQMPIIKARVVEWEI